MGRDRRFTQVEDDFIAGDLLQMKKAINYIHWQFQLIKPYLGKRILEIGPGIGNITKHLLDYSDFVLGVEPNDSCSSWLEKTYKNNEKFALLKQSVENSDIGLLTSYAFDTVICMNVLEHIENDVDVLHIFQKILKSKGNVVLVIPAIPFAYGPIDASVGHFRRYTKKEVVCKLKQAGFSVSGTQYSNFLGLLGWLFNSKISKSVKQNDSQISIFDKLVPFISNAEKQVKPPIGLSIIAVGEKLWPI